MEDVGPGPVAVDTVVFIYFIEEHAVFLPLVEPLFEAVDRGELEVVTSELTLLEVLVIPYGAGDQELADRYEALLTRSRGVRPVSLDRSVLRAAAQLRGAHRIKTPDAIQLAAALQAGCSAFVTNDRRLPNINELAVLRLAEYG
jgi:predicted nucleic acid-binding protein